MIIWKMMVETSSLVISSLQTMPNQRHSKIRSGTPPFQHLFVNVLPYESISSYSSRKNILLEFLANTNHCGSSADKLTLPLVEMQTFLFVKNWPTYFMKETTFVRKKMKNLRNDFLQLLFETSKIKLLLLPIKIYQQLP